MYNDKKLQTYMSKRELEMHRFLGKVICKGKRNSYQFSVGRGLQANVEIVETVRNLKKSGGQMAW